MIVSIKQSQRHNQREGEEGVAEISDHPAVTIRLVEELRQGLAVLLAAEIIEKCKVV